MDIEPQLYTAKVMHKRLFPKVNQFSYGVYYIALPLPSARLPQFGKWLGVNRKALLTFYDKDHGARDGSEVESWARNLLKQYGLHDPVQRIMLITMPRVLGYVFNPVSFYLCLDAEGKLRAVISEVHNTFGEQHNYVCAHEDGSPIEKNDWLNAEKLFHVSPFLEREGSYAFRFALEGEKLGVWIDYFDKDGDKQLITTLTGSLQPMTQASLRRIFWKHPLVTLKAISLIHMQALKLVSKRIRYIVKPPQKAQQHSASSNLTKM